MPRLKTVRPKKSNNSAKVADLFTGTTLQVARKLLGAKLVTCVNGVRTSGMIVEVEAYGGLRDEASHAFGGMTGRNEVMFRAAGHCYVYFIYGMYHCVNIVTEDEDVGAAVLVRALEPLEGVDVMARRRGIKGANLVPLANGPGKLCAALGINRKFCGEHFGKSSAIWIEPYTRIAASGIAASERVGISKARDLKWRFFVKGNAFLSR